MQQVKSILDFVLTKKFLFKFISYWLLIWFLYLSKSFIWLILLTFIFSYLFFSLAKFLKTKLSFCLKNKSPEKYKKCQKFISLNFIVVLEYIIFIWLCSFTIWNIIPKLAIEISELPNTLPFLNDYTWEISTITTKLEEFKTINSEIEGTVQQALNSKDYELIFDVFDKIKSTWYFILEILLALFLSFIFIIDRKKLSKYLSTIKKSSFKFLYKEYVIIFDKIVMSFWLIIKAQATIAIINTLLTILWLLFIWSLHWAIYPYLLTLALIIFIAWFIPVLWVFISSIPIIIVWYSTFWWYIIVFEIVFLVTIVHMIEAYYLNPKIVSNYFELPVSLTFLILIVSEKLFWIWWLLIWVSLYYFIVWLLFDIDKSIKKQKRLEKKKNTVDWCESIAVETNKNI